MPTKLTLKATEQSTYFVRAVFKDENGVPMTPATLTWRLTDEYGTVINGRADVVVAPAPTVDIVLAGDDLQELGHGKTLRFLTILSTYNSDLGNGLPLIDQAEFDIVKLKAVTVEDS